MDNTFSITARCSQSGDLAVAVSTARPAVGNRVPFAAAHVAAVATQAKTNPELGRKVLTLMRDGMEAAQALERALAEDSDREWRQLSIMAFDGQCAMFTGAKVLEENPWAGSARGRDCVTAGNLLFGAEVLSAMVGAFESAAGFLGERALTALEAGQASGGDKRGKVSAALLVVRAGEHPLLDLRVDLSVDPVRDLRVLYKENARVFPL